MGRETPATFFCSMGLRPVLQQRRVGDPCFTREDGSGDPSYEIQKQVARVGDPCYVEETGQETHGI